MFKNQVLYTSASGIYDANGKLSPIEAYARFQRIDEYPNQPEIVEWPMTELEKVEQATMCALSVMEAERMAAAAVATIDANALLAQAQAYANDHNCSVTFTINPR